MCAAEQKQKTESPFEILYEIDAEDRLCYVNEAWGDFARLNEGEALTAGRVVGESIWDYVAGLDTRHLYAQLLNHVRESGAPVRFTYRCDGPSCRRLLQMQIMALEQGKLRFSSRLVQAEPWESVALLEPSDEAMQLEVDEGALLVMCSICKKIKLAPGVWIEVEEAVERLDLMHSVSMPRISHGLCEECYSSVMESLAGDSAS